MGTHVYTCTLTHLHSHSHTGIASILMCSSLQQDGGSLDVVLNVGRVPEEIIGKITVAVSTGEEGCVWFLLPP